MPSQPRQLCQGQQQQYTRSLVSHTFMCSDVIPAPVQNVDVTAPIHKKPGLTYIHVQWCHSSWHFWFGTLFLMVFIFVRKKKYQNLLHVQEQCIHKLGKTPKWAETFIWCLLLIFKVVYQDHLTQLLPFAWLHRERAAAGQGPSGLKKQSGLRNKLYLQFLSFNSIILRSFFISREGNSNGNVKIFTLKSLKNSGNLGVGSYAATKGNNYATFHMSKLFNKLWYEIRSTEWQRIQPLTAASRSLCKFNYLDPIPESWAPDTYTHKSVPLWSRVGTKQYA